MKKQYREMVNTRKLYRAEVLMYGQRPFSELTKQRSLTYLRKLGETIWKKERYTNQLPVIRFGSSRSHRNIPYSWCDGDTVELAPDQQDILTLIHELVHAVGFDYHNKDFVQEEIYLLQKYTKTNKQLIEEALNV